MSLKRRFACTHCGMIVDTTDAVPFGWVVSSEECLCRHCNETKVTKKTKCFFCEVEIEGRVDTLMTIAVMTFHRGGSIKKLDPLPLCASCEKIGMWQTSITIESEEARRRTAERAEALARQRAFLGTATCVSPGDEEWEPEPFV